MDRMIEVGKIYKHFKGHIYQVVDIAFDSEKYDPNNPDASRLVVYKNMNGNDVWARPYDMFNSLVDREKYPDVKQEYRFEEIGYDNNKSVKVGIGVLILDNNKVLLGHRCKKYNDTGGIHEEDTWTLPGGKQEYGETYFEGAIRETHEETNLIISNLTVFGVGDDIAVDRQYITIYVLSKEYKGNLEVMEPDKIDKWEWFDLDNLPDNLYSPSAKMLKYYKEKR